MLGQILFLLIAGAACYTAGKKFNRVRKNILMGQPMDSSGPLSVRFRNMMLFALGQKKMFQRMVPAILHLFIYTAFLITQIELIEILIDGVSGHHRFFAGKIGFLYPLVINTIEFLSVLAFVATLVFLLRRNVLRVRRFTQAELKGFPFRDANVILFLEILLIVGIFCMNGADSLLQDLRPEHYPETGHLIISEWIGKNLLVGFSLNQLALLERAGWWLHILTVFGFLVYLPYSKHLHIVLAFPNSFWSSLKPRGRMNAIPEILHEVRSMMGLDPGGDTATGSQEIPEFGARDIFHLNRKNLMDAYSCTECGRCTDVCPANLTGKKLSPRKIMMDVRDRMEEIGVALDRSGKSSHEGWEDGKDLFHTISREEIHACTTCQACVEACPVLINPLDIILQLRRHEILTQSAGPKDWVPMFTSMENSGSPWQMMVTRDQWIRES